MSSYLVRACWFLKMFSLLEEEEATFLFFFGGWRWRKVKFFTFTFNFIKNFWSQQSLFMYEILAHNQYLKSIIQAACSQEIKYHSLK